MTQSLTPADFTLQPADVPQPTLFDRDPGEPFAWPMPAGGPIDLSPKPSLWERILILLSAWGEPFDVDDELRVGGYSDWTQL